MLNGFVDGNSECESYTFIRDRAKAGDFNSLKKRMKERICPGLIWEIDTLVLYRVSPKPPKLLK
jgi:hypothetical protein